MLYNSTYIEACSYIVFFFAGTPSAVLLTLAPSIIFSYIGNLRWNRAVLTNLKINVNSTSQTVPGTAWAVQHPMEPPELGPLLRKKKLGGKPEIKSAFQWRKSSTNLLQTNELVSSRSLL